MKRTTALIAFSSAMALATAASAQLVGGAVGGATGQVGGAVTGTTGGLTGSVTGGTRSTTQGQVTPPSRITPPAASATQSTGVDAAAKVGDRQVSGSTSTGASASAQPSVTPPAVNAPVAGAVTGQTGASASTGPVNANANAGAASATATDLTFLKAGQTVRDAKGATLGTISKVERTADGEISNVLVAAADGKKKVLKLAPDSLSISGNVVTTTSATGEIEK